MSRRYITPALLFAFVILMTVSASAQGGVQAIEACTVIDKPGSYALAKNITATQSSMKKIGAETACILILADFVSLDLRGYNITAQSGATGGFGIYTAGNVNGRPPIAAHIRNGAVSKFDRGICSTGEGDTAEQMRFTECGAGILTYGNNVTIRDVVAMFNVEGIHIHDGEGHSVERCQLRSNFDHGIVMESGGTGSRIVGNTVTGNGKGITVQCPSLILQNMVYNNGSGEKDNIVIHGTTCTRANNSPEP